VYQRLFWTCKLWLTSWSVHIVHFAQMSEMTSIVSPLPVAVKHVFYCPIQPTELVICSVIYCISVIASLAKEENVWQSNLTAICELWREQCTQVCGWVIALNKEVNNSECEACTRPWQGSWVCAGRPYTSQCRTTQQCLLQSLPLTVHSAVLTLRKNSVNKGNLLKFLNTFSVCHFVFFKLPLCFVFCYLYFP